MPPKRRGYKKSGSKTHQTTLPELAARQKLAASTPASTSPPRLILEAVVIPGAETARFEPSDVNVYAGEGSHLPKSIEDDGGNQACSPERDVAYSKKPELQKLGGSDPEVVDVEKSGRRPTTSDSGGSDEVVTPQKRRRMRRSLAAPLGGDSITLRPASAAGDIGKDPVSVAGRLIFGKRAVLPRGSQPHRTRGRPLPGLDPVENENRPTSASDRLYNQLPVGASIATRKRAHSPDSPLEGNHQQAGSKHATPQKVDDSDVEAADSGKSVQRDTLDSSDSEEVMSAQKKRKFRLSLTRSPEENRKAQRPAADEEMQDIEEDLASTANNLVLENRTRLVLNRSKVTFKKGLADLLAKRSAKNAKSPPSAEAAAETPPTTGGNDESDEGDGSDAGASTGADESGIGGAEGSNAGGDSDSWIIDDEDDSAPPVLLPAKFSRQSYIRLIDSFVIFSHHLIRKLLDPEYTPGESLDLAIETLTRKVDEYTSALQGSTWKPLISRAMKARPGFRYKKCRDDSHCDACNRTNFAAQHAVSFAGPRYDKTTLGDYEGSDAEDSEDSVGNSIVPESTVFHLGGSCFQRVKTFHNFLHWKKSLRSALEEILEEEGYIERANLIPAADRGQWAVGVAESLQGKIELLYSQLMQELRAAKKIMVR